ncbi:hypothetical protein BDQ17DRAFT_1414696 [Cyathus striatus]|nr:hypothetical protein BDQ17DRAFT_1414696 [Cyathus striatus]
MPPTIQTLPLETQTTIFTHLPISSLSACYCTSRLFKSIIEESLELQYALEKGKAGVEDNPYCNSKLSLSKKRNLLKEREEAWKTFDYKFKKCFPIELPELSTMYNVIDGTIFVGCDDSANREFARALKYIHLPRDPEEEMIWQTLDVGRTILNFGAALEEHDLIALVCYSPSRDGLDLILRRLSTQSKHPDAPKSTISLGDFVPLPHNAPQGQPRVSIDICGDTLIICLEYIENSADFILILNWKTGELKTPFRIRELSGGSGEHHDQAVIVPYYIPSAIDNSSSSLRELRPFACFQLPKIKENRMVVDLTCRGDPNPRDSPSYLPSQSGGSQVHYSKERPFRNRSENSLIVFTVDIAHGSTGYNRYMFVAHREQLLNIVQPLIPTSDIDEVSDISFIDVPFLNWSTWGPHNTRWFDYGNDLTAVICPSSTGRHGDGTTSGLGKKGWWTLVTEPSVLQDNECFSEPVRSTLPYIHTTSKEEFSAWVQFLDEESVMFVNDENKCVVL